MPFPFVIASIVIIVLAFLIRLQFPKMFAPLFIYSFMGIAEAGLLALWIALIYFKTIEDSKLGEYLGLAALVLCLTYCCLNVLGFFLFLFLVRRDRKYRVWEKQDNLCSSITITVVALLVSFRFGLLKYSKLGNLQRFSATLAADSKITHENILAYLSIGIISVPAIAISGWISYLQVTMNYLFFTSMEVTILSIMMVIISILQTFTPKGYVMENKDEYRQGHDHHNIEGESLDEVMMGIAVVEEEYHEGKEISSEAGEVNNAQKYSDGDDQYSDGDATMTAFANFDTHKKYRQNDDPLEFEDIPPMSKRPKVIPIDEREELENILIEAEELARRLEQPTRPAGCIRKQNI